MSNLVKDINEFHTKFELPQREIGKKPSRKLLAFRLKFLMEELDEFAKAIQQDNMEEALDALVDLVYVAIGTAWLLNLDFAGAWKLVHEANMLKVRATDPTASKRGSDLDVVKPVGWEKPDIASLICGDDLILKRAEVVNEDQLDILQFIADLEKVEAV
jgi:predicted HAD superfamily Cof-like phosphohydrolase